MKYLGIKKWLTLFLVFQFFSLTLLATIVSSFECGGISTSVYKKENKNVAVCHGPHTKIQTSLLPQWQDCVDAIIYIQDMHTKKSLEFADCSPMSLKQFKVSGDVFMLRHYYDVYPGDDLKPLLVEKYNVLTQEASYDIEANLPKYDKSAADKAAALIEKTVKQPFDGRTYFKAIYGSFYKLRDYAIVDPKYVLNILNDFQKRGLFDGAVSERLSSVIDEVELISKAKQ